MTGDSRQIERTAAAWLARRDAGDWSEQDAYALEAWLAGATAHRVAFVRLEAAWSEAGRLKVLAADAAREQIPARGAWSKSPFFASPIGETPETPGTCLDPDANIATHPQRRRRWATAGLAAAALLGVVLTAGGLLWRDYTHVDRGAWRTAIGAQRVVHLSDGSTATLGSDTTLRTTLSRHQRDLELAYGEAFFDVARDHARPFVVHVDGYRVIAVGTRFDVRRDAGRLRVVVTRGLVRLQSVRDPARAAAELPAGSVALVNGDDVEVRHVPPEQAAEYLSWRSGYVVFHGTPLAEAVAEFNRYNERKIVIADPALDNLRVGGNFRLDNNDGFVRLMQKVFPVRAEEQGDRIVLSHRKSAN